MQQLLEETIHSLLDDKTSVSAVVVSGGVLFWKAVNQSSHNQTIIRSVLLLLLMTPKILHRQIQQKHVTQFSIHHTKKIVNVKTELY